MNGFSAHATPGLVSLLRPDGFVSFYDGEGRPLLRNRAGGVLRRGLDGRVYRPKGDGWCETPVEEDRGLLAEARRDAGEALAAAESRALRVAGSEDLARRYLARAKEKTAGALAENALRYRAVQENVPVVPPEWYRALYLRLSVGCPYNGCDFCDLYAEKTYRRRPLSEFAAYLEDLAEVLGEASEGRRGIYLGDANPLLGPDAETAEAMNLARAAFPRAAAGGFAAFEDVFLLARDAGAEKYARLAESGLAEINYGLETGDEGLLRILSKPLLPSALAARADAAHVAGLRVAISVLVGAGGSAFSENHVSGTVRAIEECRLGPSDIVYLSPLRLDPTGSLAARMRAAGTDLLSPEGLREEEACLGAALRARTPARIIPYRVDRYID